MIFWQIEGLNATEIGRSNPHSPGVSQTALLPSFERLSTGPRRRCSHRHNGPCPRPERVWDPRCKSDCVAPSPKTTNAFQRIPGLERGPTNGAFLLIWLAIWDDQACNQGCAWPLLLGTPGKHISSMPATSTQSPSCPIWIHFKTSWIYKAPPRKKEW